MLMVLMEGMASAVCTASATAFSAALSAYVAAPTDKTKCQAYKDTGTKYLSDCAIYATAADLKAAQADLNSLVCK